jgi:hypothetical protein
MLFMRSCCAAEVAAPCAIACRLVADLPSADDEEEIGPEPGDQVLLAALPGEDALHRVARRGVRVFPLLVRPIGHTSAAMMCNDVIKSDFAGR